MKRFVSRVSMLAVGAGVSVVMLTGTAALADKPGGGGGYPPGTPCPDHYYPMLCPDGVYFNECYALQAGQKNCVPLWDPPRPLP